MKRFIAFIITLVSVAAAEAQTSELLSHYDTNYIGQSIVRNYAPAVSIIYNHKASESSFIRLNWGGITTKLSFPADYRVLDFRIDNNWVVCCGTYNDTLGFIGYFDWTLPSYNIELRTVTGTTSIKKIAFRWTGSSFEGIAIAENSNNIVAGYYPENVLVEIRDLSSALIFTCTTSSSSTRYERYDDIILDQSLGQYVLVGVDEGLMTRLLARTFPMSTLMSGTSQFYIYAYIDYLATTIHLTQLARDYAITYTTTDVQTSVFTTFIRTISSINMENTNSQYFQTSKSKLWETAFIPYRDRLMVLIDFNNYSNIVTIDPISTMPYTENFMYGTYNFCSIACLSYSFYTTVGPSSWFRRDISGSLPAINSYSSSPSRCLQHRSIKISPTLNYTSTVRPAPLVPVFTSANFFIDSLTVTGYPHSLICNSY